MNTAAALLELPSVRRQISPLSVEEYHRMGELNENGRRTELIRGVVIEKIPRSPLHARLVRRLFRSIQAAAGSGLFVLKEDPLTLVDSEPEPDVAVVAGVEDDFDNFHPTTALLVVEVAITTIEIDREKAALYAEANVPEYWIVIPERGLVEVYTSPRAGLYTERRILTTADGGTLVSAALPALRVDLGSLFGDAA